MAIALTAVVVRHERRIRLFFSEALSASAFIPALYVVTPAQGSVPGILAVYIVQNSPNVVEIAFDRDLSPWTTYTAAALGVPGADGSVTDTTPDVSNSSQFALGGTVTPPDVENPDDDLNAFVYGTDLVYDGTDFVETDEGDLATVSGIANLDGALNRRLAQSCPLPWDPGYGDRPGDYVNGPSPLAGTLSGNAVRQAISDDRVRTASATFGADPNDPSNTVITIVIVPIGATDGATPISVPIVTG